MLKLKRAKIFEKAVELFYSMQKKTCKKEIKKSLTKLMRKYEKIEINDIGHEITFHTRPIHIKYDKHLYNIGKIRVTLEIGYIKNYIYFDKFLGKDIIHPHIEFGEACFGNLNLILQTMLKEGNLIGALHLVHKFLHSYNAVNAYENINNWPKLCKKRQ